MRRGVRRDAILFSVSANATHGHRRSNADKRRAVLTLLADVEWAGWSDREIARQCSVGADMVGRLRPEVSVAERQIDRTVARNGKSYTMNTAAIGKTRASDTAEDEQKSGLRFNLARVAPERPRPTGCD